MNDDSKDKGEKSEKKTKIVSKSKNKKPNHLKIYIRPKDIKCHQGDSPSLWPVGCSEVN